MKAQPVPPPPPLPHTFLHHIAVQTTDLDNCTTWYRDFLGCRRTWATDRFSDLTVSRLPGIVRMAELARGDTRFHLFERAASGEGRRPPARDAVPARLHGRRLPGRTAPLARPLVGTGPFRSRYEFSLPDPPTDIVMDDDGVESFYCLDVNGLEFRVHPRPGGRLVTPGAPAALALPTTGSWDFSDYPYGLEPLTTPAREPYATGGCVRHADVAQVCRALCTRADEGFEITRPAVGHTLERLFWFRWITGHQISFVIWRLLADALARLSAGEGDRDELSAEITQHVRGYCGMLLYTGSCDRAVYNGTIRPSMYRLHSTFSGTWAPDYPAVRSLFRGRKVPPVAASQVDALVREVRLSSQIHLGVASRLVTGGRSCSSGPSPTGTPSSRGCGAPSSTATS